MPIERGYTMIQISFEGRELLRALAYLRHKPMYEVLEAVLKDTLAREKKKVGAIASVGEHDGDI